MHAWLTRGLAALLLVLPATMVVATPTDIANAPLVTAAPTQIRPNLMFILDDSGSMSWDYMPDWVNGHEGTISGLHFCRASAATATGSGNWNGRCCRNGTEGQTCLVGAGAVNSGVYANRRPEPPFLSSDFNGSAYNPATTYLPPRDANGVPWPSQTAAHTSNWTNVRNDAFGVQSTHSINLTTQFPDSEWCTDTTHTDCLRQGNYVLPGRVDGRNYHVFRPSSATGTGRIAVGDPFNATSLARTFGPHFFRIVPAEFCAGANLRDCVVQTAPTPSHPHPAPLRWCNSDANSRALTPAAGSCQATRAPPFVHARFPTKIGGPAAGQYPGRFERVDILPGMTFPRAPTRADCAAATHCTYEEEMTNFANWWAYHRTRMQTMKSATTLAFSAASDQLRVGYKSINNATGSDFLNLDTFSGAHRTAWFNRVLLARPSGPTPLRRSLSTVGRMYAGQLNGTTLFGSTVVEPMLHSCQRNFTLLSTDGFWNETTTPPRIDGSTPIGDVDGRSGVPRPFFDGTGTANSLSDVALYYWETDLRTPALNNCTGPAGVNLCTNNVPATRADPGNWQRMTTFTLGLGVPGSMQFDPNYLSATSGDFHAVATGLPANPAAGICSWQPAGTACTWPRPVAATLTAIDDLWHAAVNGRGTYFAASDPASLHTGLTQMLQQINNRVGTAAAATTSNPNVSAGDNFVFLSSYVSGAWLGQLSGKSVDLVTGEVLDSASDWHAAQRLTSDAGRRILFFDGAAPNRLRDFTWANLAGRTDPDGGAALRSYFELPHITAPGRALSQFCSFGSNCLSAANQGIAAGERLLNFVRGARADEGPAIDTTRFFRERRFTDPDTGLVKDTVLGSIVNSEAVYVGRTPFRFPDPGFTAHQAATAARAPMVYVGSNGGMLHAFDARTGDELWAYVPTMVMRNLYHLADKDYASRHRFFVDATPAVADVMIGGQWRTLLVGGLGAGGRGYFALDVTDPSTPRALWEFTHANLGLSFGRPEIARLRDGTWVVLLASGYNNILPGDGRGRLFVLDATTGALIRSIDTGAGSTANPAGLAHIRAWVDNTEVDNTVLRVYGGDLLGNLWRFDVNGDIGAPGFDAQRLATLRGPEAGNPAQPITTRPELGLVAGRPMVYVGTGRYLGMSDLTSALVQSIYAIEDLLDTTDHGSPRASTRFAHQTLNPGTCPVGSSFCDPADTVRIGGGRAVNLASDDGWFIDLPQSSERITTDPQLALGTLVVTSNVVNADACLAGGSSFINFLDFRTGLPVATAHGIASVALGNALATRPALMRLPGGKITSLTRMSNDSTVVRDIPVVQPGQGTRRLSWRELVLRQR
jgi:type IV pilus assembly protein PilY1